MMSETTTEPRTDTDTPWEPPLAGTETAALLGALDRQRWTFRFKAGDLDAAGLRVSLGCSSLTLGGLLKHLASAGDYMSTVKLSGADMDEAWRDNGWDVDDDWEFSSAADDSPEYLYALYDGAAARARQRVAAALAEGGLDQEVAAADGDGHHANLRRLLLDMVEEDGRPTGPADRTREGGRG